jgi:hypothetical protein
MNRSLVAAALAVLGSSALASPRTLAPAAAPGAAAGHLVAGVQVQLEPAAWRWGELAFERTLAPVRVTVTNQGRQPVLVRYHQFVLRSTFGELLAPEPPYRVAGEPELVRLDRGANRGFEYAPWSPRQYGDAVRLPTDPRYFRQRDAEAPVILPFDDVMSGALPEGILQPGGTVTGFLYFPEHRPGTDLTFLADVVDAGTGRVEGTVAIPVVVR